MECSISKLISRPDILSAIDDNLLMVVLVDRTGKVLLANANFCRRFGYEDKEELLGTNFLFFSENFVSCSEKERERSLSSESEYVSKLDKIEFWEAMGKYDKYEKEMVRRSKFGKCIWVNSIILPVKSQSGVIGAFLNVMTDISDRKEAEFALQKMKDQLIQAQKMEDVGRLASGIAHDFNNILMPIMCFTELGLMAAEKNEPEKIIAFLQKVDKSAKRAAHLVERMLSFSRDNASEKKRTAINPTAILEEILELGELLRAGIGTSMVLLFDEQLHNLNDKIVIDSAELYQIVTNLIVNAHDAIAATKHYGKIKITLSKKTLMNNNEFCCASCGENILGEYIVISIQDTGHGITKEGISKIFNPFFTTKEKGKGTGLGLSMVSSLMHEVHGHIAVESTVDVGTIFSLFFPVVTEMQASSYLSATKEFKLDDFNNELKICVIDDDEAMRDALKESLTHSSYDVKTFAGAIEALRYFENDVDFFDLIITDYRMPIMNGDEFAEKVFKLRPRIPIIFCTGYRNLLTSVEDLPKGNTALIHKPIGAKKINNIIKEMFIGL